MSVLSHTHIYIVRIIHPHSRMSAHQSLKLTYSETQILFFEVNAGPFTTQLYSYGFFFPFSFLFALPWYALLSLTLEKNWSPV